MSNARKKFRVYGIVTGTKYLGEFEAETEEEATAMGLNSTNNSLSICHRCSESFDLDDVACGDAHVEEVQDD
nr:hypothetical protein [uncultured Roseateles sp.]